MLLIPARRMIRSGLLGPLTTPHGVQGYVGLLHPASSLADHRAELIAVRRPGYHCVTIGLRPTTSWSGFRAGQFVRLTLPVAGIRETRCYSPAGAEQERGHIELTVARHRGGKVSRHLYDHARPGMVVGLSDAEGDFVLPRPRPDRLLLIASGSGITPIMAILRTLCAEQHTGPVTLLHYSPNPRRAIYRPQLQAIAERHPNVRVAFAYTRQAVSGHLSGHISRAHLRRVAPDYRLAHTYVCGAPGLLAWVRTAWIQDGIERLLHLESFLASPLAPVAQGGPADPSVCFARSGKRLTGDARPLLEQAERAGLQPQFGCRMGICRLCTSRKTAGRVRNVLTGEVSGAEQQDIQICVSAPYGDVELAL